jgi:ligand-binding sensor protein
VACAKSCAILLMSSEFSVSELFNFTPFCQLMRQHPQHSSRCRMSDRCGGLETARLVACAKSCAILLMSSEFSVLAEIMIKPLS